MHTFELLETIRWRPLEGFFLLERHLNRLQRSAAHFGFVCRAGEVEAALDRAVAGAAGPLRIRLLVAREGGIRVETRPLDVPTASARVALAVRPIDPSDVFLFHKTTNRHQYDEARLPGVDDVVLWNPSREITETTIANLVVEQAGRRVTPPIASGLLAGTFREHLLANREIEEAPVTIDALLGASRFWLINSVREWWPAAFVLGP